jgi:DNA-binding transcriptional LysR family regulator
MTVRPNRRTVRLEDMRLFSSVAAAKSFTLAGRELDVPKQTLSRRIAELERALGVQLLQRTTRRIELTDDGRAYAERCAEIVRAAEEANRALTDSRSEPSGVLRITADPLFGDAFLAPLVIAFAQRWPQVEIEVMLTRRRVDLVEEGFDVAFRVGAADDKRLVARRLGPARVRYCASPRYVRARGAPKTPDDLGAHDCLVVQAGGEPSRWPVTTKKGVALRPISGRLRFSTLALTHAAALAGLGIGLFPDFVCREDLRRKRLVSVLEPTGIDVGGVWLVHPAQRHLAARISAFVDLAVERLAADPPWVDHRR